LLAMCLMYFVVVNNIRTKTGTVPVFINLFLFSSGIAVTAAYLSVFNIWSRISDLPWVMQFRTFNPVNGSLEGLAVFLTVVVSAIIGLLLNSKLQFKIKNILQILLLFASVVLLILIDFWPAWVVLGSVLLVLLIISFWTRMFRERVNVLILPIILLLIVGAGLATDLTFVRTQFGDSSGDLPQEAILDYKTAWLVSLQALKDEPVFGSGPGTFFANFSKFKPVEFNENRFWNIRFDKGPSQILEMIGTVGILGMLSYLALVVMFLLIMFLGIRRMKDSKLILPILLAWFALLFGQIVYLQSTVLAFYFWLFTGLAIVVWQKSQLIKPKKLVLSLKKLPELGLIANVILLILVFVIVGLFYVGGRFYLADMKFSKAPADNQEYLKNLVETVNLNKYRENYRRILSQAYLVNAWAEARKPQEEQNIQLLQTYAAGAIQQAREAASISPNLVTVWENLGMVYRDSRGLVGGTLPFALEAFAKALELEPTSPLYYRELCRLSLISEEKDWDKTVGHCQKAIELKQNYLDAHIQLALVYEQKGDLEKALIQMQSVLEKLKGISFQRGSTLAGAATEIYFQLGRLHFNLDHMADAIKMFEQAVIITPEYANARYALGMSYQASERYSDALIQFQLVNQLVPGNQDVMTRIGQLQEMEIRQAQETEGQ